MANHTATTSEYCANCHVVGQLGRGDAEITITVEIEARAEKGFTDDIRRTVSENARTLKFSTDDFEER
jgi:hypothetical protein